MVIICNEHEARTLSYRLASEIERSIVRFYIVSWVVRLTRSSVLGSIRHRFSR